jgi:hypothetical protein
VPPHVVQGLRDDPVCRHLGRRGQSGQVAPAGDLHVEAVGTEPPGLLLDGPQQTELVERGRAQIVHQPADVGEDPGQVVRRPGELLVGALGIGPGQVAGCLDPQRHRTEARAEPVVQVAPQPAALVLTGDHELGPDPLQGRAQLARAGGRGGLPDQVTEQPLVVLAENRPVRRGEHQPADRLAAVPDRQRDQLAGRLAVFDDGPLATGSFDLDPHVPQPERLGHGPGHGHQLLVRVAGQLEPLGQRRHRRVRIVARAAQQPADGPPQPGPQRRVDDGDHGDGDQCRVPLAEQASGQREHHHVHPDHQQGQDAVQERCRQQPVDVV